MQQDLHTTNLDDEPFRVIRDTQEDVRGEKKILK